MNKITSYSTITSDDAIQSGFVHIENAGAVKCYSYAINAPVSEANILAAHTAGETVFVKDV